MNTFKVLCVYDMTLVLLKWNGKMFVKWLSEQFWSYCSYMYVLIETADERHTRCVFNVSKQNRASAPFIQRWPEHAGFMFKSTFAAYYLQILVHIAIWFKCNDLLLINSSKLWHISWHSTLNCKFRCYDWILRFRPRFLHRGNHRALHYFSFVIWSFRNNSNMLLWCPSFFFFLFLTNVLLNIFLNQWCMFCMWYITLVIGL